MLICKFGRSISCVLLYICISTVDSPAKEISELIIKFLEASVGGTILGRQSSSR